MFRSKSHLAKISRPPILERWIPAGSDPIVTLPFTHEEEFIHRPNRPFLRERIFHFSSDSLYKLKARVNSECNTTKISTLQSLTDLVWRCVTRARRLLTDQETGCKMAVNNRTRLSPPIPETYFGNISQMNYFELILSNNYAINNILHGKISRSMIQTVKTITTAGELLDHGIGWAAFRLNEAVASHGYTEIKKSMDLWVKKPFVVNLGVDVVGTGVLMGSSPRFDMYGNEFGLGKASAVLSGYNNKFDGKMTAYPGREGGGSIDLEVYLLPETMAAFEIDEEFMNVVNK